jgi:Uma2 family endonuclease
VLIVNPPPGYGELRPNDKLGAWLSAYEESEAGRFVCTIPEAEIRVGAGRRRPDRAIWIGNDRIPDPYNDVPAILIEFVSQRRRDRLRDFEVKRDEYRAIGVKEYWVFDRFQRRLTVHRFFPDRLETVVATESDVYSTDLLPGFVLSVGRLQAEADRVARPRRDRTGGEP